VLFLVFTLLALKDVSCYFNGVASSTHHRLDMGRHDGMAMLGISL
jgi:hypothetical protein